MGTIVVTGFEPFGNDRANPSQEIANPSQEIANPSQEIAKVFDGRQVGTCAVRGIVLPVDHTAARALVTFALSDPELVGVVHLGLAGGRARIALEGVAVNVMDYSIPDAKGQRFAGEPCVMGGPAAYFSTLPNRAVLTALMADGVPAYLSYTAGTYLCNHTLYWTLHEIAQRGLAVRAGFMHVPFLPSMVAAHGLDEPSMSLSTMIQAAEITLRVLAEG
ncbi:MAG: pyroglutamyl-peptidase I [Candidatus Rokuibacteriota bacterium]